MGNVRRNKNSSKEFRKKIFNLLKNNPNQIKRGANEVTKQIERSKALLVVMAADTSPIEIIGHLPLLCNDKGVPYVYVESSDSLGAATGLERKVVSCCIFFDDDRQYDRVKSDIGAIIADLNGLSV